MTPQPHRAGRGGSRRGRLRIRVHRLAGPEVVSVRVWLRGGSRVEPIPGLALVAGRMLAEGTARRDWRTIAEEAEARGMVLESFGGFEVSGVAVDALAADWRLAVEWAAELVLEPSFDAQRFAWMVRQATGELRALQDRPEVVTGWEFLRRLYHPHPRSRPVHGSAASLGSLTPEDCSRFHRDSLERGMVVAIAGDIREEACLRQAGRLFGSGAGRSRPAPALPPPAGLPATRVEIATGAVDQTHLLVGRTTVSRRDPAYPALEVLGVILGSGPGVRGRVPARIREREGLAYEISADTVAGSGLDPGHLSVYLATSPENLARAERAVAEELAEAQSRGVSAEEVEAARAYLLGVEPFRRETAAQLAELQAAAELLDLPVDDPAWRADELASVTRAQVDAAASRYLTRDGLTSVVGLPREPAASIPG